MASNLLRLLVLELCGAFVVAFGEFQMMHSRFASLITTFWPIYASNTLVVTGTIVTCVCYLGVLGGMKENRCMLITVSSCLMFAERAERHLTDPALCVPVLRSALPPHAGGAGHGLRLLRLRQGGRKLQLMVPPLEVIVDLHPEGGARKNIRKYS